MTSSIPSSRIHHGSHVQPAEGRESSSRHRHSGSALEGGQSSPAPNISRSYGDRRLHEARQRLAEMQSDSPYLDGASHAVSNRADALTRLAHGDLPNPHGVRRGAEAMASLGGFYVSGGLERTHTHDLLSAGRDMMRDRRQHAETPSLSQLPQMARNAAHGARQVAQMGYAAMTATEEGIEETRQAAHDLVRNAAQQAGGSLAAGAAGGTLLRQAAAQLASRPVLSQVVRIAGHTWAGAGLLAAGYAADRLSRALGDDPQRSRDTAIISRHMDQVRERNVDRASAQRYDALHDPRHDPW